MTFEYNSVFFGGYTVSVRPICLLVKDPETGALELRHEECTAGMNHVVSRSLDEYRPPEDEDPICNGCGKVIPLSLYQN